VFDQQASVFVGGVLHAAVGVMDQPWLELSLSQCHLECRKRKARFECAVHSPADHLARKCIQHHCQIDKLCFQPDVSNIGRPQLIDPAQRHLPRQVPVNSEVMPRVSGCHHEFSPSQAQQVIFSHHALHALVILLGTAI